MLDLDRSVIPLPEKHSAGVCQPCVFFASRGGCQPGTPCTFCHFTHGKKVNHRPPKAIRNQMKKAVEEILQVPVGDLVGTRNPMLTG